MPRNMKVPGWPPDHARQAYRDKYLTGTFEIGVVSLATWRIGLMSPDVTGCRCSWDIGT